MRPDLWWSSWISARGCNWYLGREFLLLHYRNKSAAHASYRGHALRLMRRRSC